ncbi:winged helix-turn-helix domain-containing protein [Actinospica sp. MGRD01-02]|uniref:Winged helix-turn-helix domain-containing protein n=1 Tax=Actinospica acidithermotolerans TaxID=2828514 RepID=A0A941EAR2_9ACTN|nr:BTAD domain-containing putative transcriptional regulator [Actinospica acidithermotolerans]MBR7829355.1 winged helix-turn-helix domain-containing protein [Actinospica acidithermotolerans]
MRVAILGTLEVRAADGLVEIPGRRLRALLIRLALDPGRVVSAERLIDDLWQDEPPNAAHNALQALVSRLRALVGRATIEQGGGGYRLNVRPEDVDLVRFENYVRHGRACLESGDAASAAQSLRDALALWRGTPLSDVEGMPFAEPETAALDEQRVAAVEYLVDALLAQPAPAADLLPELEQLRIAFPFREGLHARYMKVLYALGRQAEALAAYEELRATLAGRLGVDPSPELTKLHLAMLRQEPAAAPVAPIVPIPLRQVAPRRGNLPAQLTSFIGRESELELVSELLCNARLVTLNGPGGAGKTRLAQECGARLSELAPDGVWFAPLAAVADGAHVAQAVLTALGGENTLTLAEIAIEGVDTVDPRERLHSLVAERRMILILDNCEHVLDAVADLVDKLLAAAPGVRVLATSREPLALTGETLCPVASLALPPEAATDLTVEAPPAESAAEYAAVRLFVERAGSVRPGFQLTAANAEPVVRICRALDGIPLAIELAAARLRSLTAQQVADRLDDRFRLLSSGSRTALPRHQTLRAIVDWSWDLLTPGERTVLARLSAFAGGAMPEAATHVCGTEPDEVIDVIASLVDKSLVVAQEDDAGEVRYRLLETVRAYAADRLEESGERARVQDAHAAHFAALAERAEPELRTADQLRWITRITLEHDNFSAALRHCVAGEDVVTALRIFHGLLWFWMMRNFEKEATEWAEEIGALVERSTPEIPAELTEAQLLCTLMRKIVRATQKNADDAEAVGKVLLEGLPEDTSGFRHPLLALARPVASVLITRGADAARTRGRLEALAGHPDPWVRAARYSFAALLELNDANPEAAEQLLLTGYARFREIGERQGLMFTLVVLTEFALAKGRFRDAVDYAEEAHAHATDGMTRESGSMLLIRVGLARSHAGEMEQGRRTMERAVATAERCGEFSDAATGHAELAALAFRAGDRAEARRRLSSATELIEAHSERRDVSMARSNTLARRGYLAILDGDFDIARDCFRRAVDVVWDGPFLSFMSGLDEVLRGLAALAAAECDHVRAAELLGAAFAVTGMENQASYADPHTRAAALAALGQDAFDAAFARGRRLPKADVLALAP